MGGLFVICSITSKNKLVPPLFVRLTKRLGFKTYFYQGTAPSSRKNFPVIYSEFEVTNLTIGLAPS